MHELSSCFTDSTLSSNYIYNFECIFCGNTFIYDFKAFNVVKLNQH